VRAAAKHDGPVHCGGAGRGRRIRTSRVASTVRNAGSGCFEQQGNGLSVDEGKC
jgi:hypothetical protein